MDSTNSDILNRILRIIAGLAVIVIAVWLINILKNVLLPFCIACLIAYLLEPIVEWNRKTLHLPWRIAAIAVTLSEVTLVAGAMIYFCVPSIASELHQMNELIKSYSADNNGAFHVPDYLKNFFDSLTDSDNVRRLQTSAHIGTIMSKGTSLMCSIADILLRTLDWLLTFIYVIFILLDYHRLIRGFRLLVPPRIRPATTQICNDIKDSMNRYFRGQALIALCAALFYCIGFSIVGIPMAIVTGMCVGILYMIPYFQYVTLIPVAVICFIYSMETGTGFWSAFGGCLLVYVCSQCICDYILTPKIMGKAMGLNPAIILLSLSVWGTLLGLIGLIIALPLTTLLLAYYKEFVIDREGNGSATPVARQEERQ